jgi:hypothetical protein
MNFPVSHDLLDQPGKLKNRVHSQQHMAAMLLKIE